VNSPSENPAALTTDVSQLVSTLVEANVDATHIDPIATSALTVGWRAPPTHVSAQVAFAVTGSSAGSLGECLSAARGTANARCVIAISVSLGGSAHASVSPATGDETGCAGGSSLAGPAVGIAVSANGNASSLAKRGNDAAGCASDQTSTPGATSTPASTTAASTAASIAASTGGAPPAVTTAAPDSHAVSGATGAAVGIALADTGAAASSASSGGSGLVAGDGATGNGAGGQSGAADADSGRTGDAIGVAIGKIGAIAIVRSGDSGAATSTCVGCVMTAVPAGGTAVATATSGDTGSSYALAIAGLIATVNAQSGNTGDATSLTGVDTSATPGAGGGAIAIGRSGQTGDVTAIAVSADSSATITTQSGVSGGVVSVSLQGALCASPSATAVITCSVPPDQSGAPSVTVDNSKPGLLIIRAGAVGRETLIPAFPGTSTTIPASAADPIVDTDVRAPVAGPRYQPVTDTTPLSKRAATAEAARNKTMAALAPMVFGSGLMVLALVLLVAGFVRRRKVRYLKRR